MWRKLIGHIPSKEMGPRVYSNVPTKQNFKTHIWKKIWVPSTTLILKQLPTVMLRLHLVLMLQTTTVALAKSSKICLVKFKIAFLKSVYGLNAAF